MTVAGTVAAATLMGSQTAGAQEYCVACAEPDAVYRCVIENAVPGSGTPLQLLCITRMAELGKHASCAVKRVTVIDCDGRVVRISAAAPADGTVPAPATVEPIETAKPDGPDTLLGVMKEAGKTSKEKLKSAGDAVGEGAKKSWNCVTSFFSKC